MPIVVNREQSRLLYIDSWFSKNVRSPQNVTFNVIYSLVVETSLLLTAFPVLDSKNKLGMSYSSCGETATRQELPHSSTDIILSKERTQLQVRTA